MCNNLFDTNQNESNKTHVHGGAAVPLLAELHHLHAGRQRKRRTPSSSVLPCPIDTLTAARFSLTALISPPIARVPASMAARIWAGGDRTGELHVPGDGVSVPGEQPLEGNLEFMSSKAFIAAWPRQVWASTADSACVVWK